MRRLWRIGFRLLAFNLLLVFLPVAGILYLDVYERELLAAQERGMIQESRAAAAALMDAPDLSVAARRLAEELAHQGSRIRIYGADTGLIADSASVPQASRSAAGPYSGDDAVEAGVRDTPLYRLGALFAGLRTWFRTRLYKSAQPYETPQGAPQELRAALAGRYGAATRPTPGQRSMTLTSAWPIRNGSTITGAVVTSQTTFRTLTALYRVRLRLFRIILGSVAAAILLSALVSGTVVRPLKRLRRAASSVSSRRESLLSPFPETHRRDEIGDIARALQELTSRLDEHIKQLEAFSADVAHEFRNPLAAIRVAAETIASTGDAAERERFLERLTENVDRLDRLVSGVRDLANLDAQIAHEPRATADLPAIVRAVAEGAALDGGVGVSVTPDGSSPLHVRGSADRLAQVFENIIANARSFSSADVPVTVSVERVDGFGTVSIADRGPGIPESHRDRVFERFFTYRPDDPPGKRDHTGLGLAIAKAIVEGYGGTITAQNRAEGGSVFEVRLPLARIDD